jgi:hypothetical protein
MTLVLAMYIPQSDSLKFDVDADKPRKHHNHLAKGSHKPLAAGCKLVYLDIGSNVGVQVRKLFEPHKYPEAKILRHFDKYFGNADVRKQPSGKTGLCAFGFEANPSLERRLRTIQDAYKAQQWRVTFVAPRIVSDVDDQNVTFYVDSNKVYNEWGSSITPWRGTDNMTAVTVKTLDFASWFEKEIVPANPKVVLAKMDIEGSEYLVLPRLIGKNFLCKHIWNAAQIEWHKGMNPTTKSRFDLEHDVMGQKCLHKTKFERMDDETYVLDGAPLPGNFSSEARMALHGSATSIYSINVSKALYKAAHLSYLKRSGISEGTQSNNLLTEINELVAGLSMNISV